MATQLPVCQAALFLGAFFVGQEIRRNAAASLYHQMYHTNLICASLPTYPQNIPPLHSLASQPAFTSSLYSLASQPAFTPACFSRICLPFVQNFGLVWRPAMTFLSSPFGGRLGCLGPIDRYARITPSAMTFS